MICGDGRAAHASPLRTRILPCRHHPPLPMRRPIPKQKGEPPCDSPCLPDLPWGYFFSGGWLNGKVPNMFLAWLCICSCICTNRFLLCSM